MMGPIRRADWQESVIAYLNDCRNRVFEPGHYDCALFCAGAIEAMTGVDPAAGLRGIYDTEEAGFAIIRAAGYDDHIAMVARLFEEIAVSMARPGDIAVIPAEGNLPALGLVQGEWVYVPRVRGFGTVPLISATRAFAVR